MGVFEMLGLDEERFNKNHAAAGSSNGGQFVAAGSAGGAGGKTASKAATRPAAKPAARPATKTAAKAAPAKPARMSAHQKHLAHLQHEQHLAAQVAAAKTTSHAPLVPGGKNDPARVRQLQGLLAALKIGNVNSSGNYDSNTVAAVEEAQRRLGLKTVNGHASASLIDKLHAAQALSPCLHSQGSRGSTPVFLESRASNPDKPYGNVTYADPGYQDDGQARYPLDSEQHVRAAWGYINQSDNASRYSSEHLDLIKKRIMAAGKKYGIEFADDSEPDNDTDAGRSARLALCTRSYDFELREVSRDGRRLVGRVAVFNVRTRIPDRGGDFEEETHPGFMDRSLNAFGYPVMQFDHGKDPRTGTVPIGVYDDWDGNNRSGYDVAGELFDNPVVEPIRQAIMGKAVKGMSWRMQVKNDKWERRRGGPDVRHIFDADVPEAGPVVFPAYRDTAVSVRSILATFDDAERDELIRELREQAGLATDLTDFTGRSDTWRADGGEYDEPWPWEGGASTSSKEQRARQMALLRPPIALP